MIMIIEYDSMYDEEVKDLLVELQEYIASIDKEKCNVLTAEYREKGFSEIIDEIKKYQGKMLLAKENNKIIGLVVGVVNNDEKDEYNFKTPRRGRITEFIVTKDCRASGVGTLLLKEMEKHLKSIGCEDILLGVFGYNEDAIKFYDKNEYHTRMIDMIKVDI